MTDMKKAIDNLRTVELGLFGNASFGSSSSKGAQASETNFSSFSGS
jgi:hypothetical protein